MKYTTATLCLAAAAAASAKHIASRGLEVLSEVPDGYTVVPMTWRGSIQEGGPEMTFSGTIEQITEQIQRVRPDFSPGHAGDDSGVEASTLQQQADKVANQCDSIRVPCTNAGGTTDRGANLYQVEQMRDTLSDFPDLCEVEAGPRVCARVACVWNAGVWLCNDNASAVSKPCHDLAGYVQDVIDTCRQPDPDSVDTFVRGQEFDSEGFNVCVGSSTC